MSFYRALPDGADDDDEEEEEQVVDIEAICTTPVPAHPSGTTAAAPLSGVPVYIQL